MLRKKCPRCSNKVSRGHDFCPYCGYPIKKRKEEDKGLIDRDLEREMQGFGGMGSGVGRIPFEKIINGLVKELISSGELKIKVRKLGKDGMNPVKIEKISKEKKQGSKAIPQIVLSKEQAERIAKLPQTEPGTTVRRLTDKIVYEIELPGVKEKDVIINKLQNSIEIKAFTKDKAFSKLIPVSFPITNYSLKKGKLILELKPEA